ncbi:hypothetical protein [Hymenobacter cavernae]|uniref:Uncharacterized protein n=1 Tax=Hymenobacter cavernae TaxID=2044852 RepID=A0ABQ1UHM5_9BACT|nr:hypothetical protein [Hymenobacter cavernae]GGF19245.1 hypothetical protein GCM10011383_33500 [Hymenobacter cavernae]
MKRRIIYAGLLFVASSCNFSQSGSHEYTQPTYRINFYIENNSPTQPAIGLTVIWDTSLIAQDTFRYTRISDQYSYYTRKEVTGNHHLKIVDSSNKLSIDTTLNLQDSLTHVFVGFAYNKLDTTELNRIKKQHYPEGDSVVIKALSEPKRLIVHLEHGQISIP